MTETILTIKGIDYKIKPSFRASLEFEKINKKLGESSGETDSMIRFLYSALVANNRTEPNAFRYSFDELIDELDNDPSIFEQFNKMGENEASADEPKVKGKSVKK